MQLVEQRQDLRLDRHVERGGRLVGDQHLAARRPGRWRSSPAGAGRPRAGAGSRPAAPCGWGRPTSSSTSSARSVASLPEAPAVQAHRLGHLLADRLGRVQRRLASPGRSSPPRCRAPCASRDSGARPARARRALIEPSTICPPCGSRPRIDSPSIDLPQPDSPTRPSVSPGVDRRGRRCRRHARPSATAGCRW